MIHNPIESVQVQTYQDWELIIVDDGSTDNTKEVVKNYEIIDNRIKYFYQKNSERSAARNNGIKEAKGDWICFLDSDDIYHKDHLEEFKKLISEKKKKGLYFSGVSYGKYDKTTQKYNLRSNNDLEFIFLNTIGTPRACVSKEILKKHNFDEQIKIGEDKELWSRITQQYPVFYHRKKTFIELEHSDRSINVIKNKIKHIRTTKLILNKVNSYNQLKKKVLSDSYFSVSKFYLNNNLKFKALQFITISLFIDFINEQTLHKIYICLSLSFLIIPKEYRK